MNTASIHSPRTAHMAHASLWMCALIWGGSFVLQKTAMADISPLLFNALRSALAATVLLMCVVALRCYSKKSPSKNTRDQAELPASDVLAYGASWLTVNELKFGLHLGFWLWLAFACQQIGLVDTMAYRASFITGLYIMFVPFLMRVFFSTSVASWQLSMAGLGSLGLFLLTTSADDFGMRRGDVWVLVSAVMWAMHVVVLGQNKQRGRLLQIACVQMLGCAVLSALSSWLLQEDWAWWRVSAVMWPLLYLGVLASGVAFTFQVFGQNIVAPSVAAIILSFEAMLGAWAGWYFLQEPFSLRNLVGAVLIVLAIGLVEVTNHLQVLAQRSTLRKSHASYEPAQKHEHHMNEGVDL